MSPESLDPEDHATTLFDSVSIPPTFSLISSGSTAPVISVDSRCTVSRASEAGKKIELQTPEVRSPGDDKTPYLFWPPERPALRPARAIFRILVELCLFLSSSVSPLFPLLYGVRCESSVLRRLRRFYCTSRFHCHGANRILRGKVDSTNFDSPRVSVVPALTAIFRSIRAAGDTDRTAKTRAQVSLAVNFRSAILKLYFKKKIYIDFASLQILFAAIRVTAVSIFKHTGIDYSLR